MPFRSIGNLAARSVAQATLATVREQWRELPTPQKEWKAYQSVMLHALALEHVGTTEPTYSKFFYCNDELMFEVRLAKDDTECSDGAEVRRHQLLAERLLRTVKL